MYLYTRNQTISDVQENRSQSSTGHVHVSDHATWCPCINSERVTNTTVEDLYADGAYQSPDNRAFAEGHAGMRLKTGNGKTRYRGLLKHRMQAYARCAWMNFRRVVIFQSAAFQRTTFYLFWPLRGALGCMKLIFSNQLQVRPFCRESPRIAI